MSDEIAFCQAIALTEVSEENPNWLHLLPKGEIQTKDGRGPYRYASAQAIISASLSSAGDKLVLCENHASDLAAPKGNPSPARGWIVELQQRANGIWGRVEWTPTGLLLMQKREYRGVSPVIKCKKSGEIVAILRATLTNTPNLEGLITMHSQDTDTQFRALIIQALGLSPSASDERILSFIEQLRSTDPSINSNQSAQMEAVLLSQKAAAYQKKLAGFGHSIDFASAVYEVQAGKV
ncbi:phage protease [Pontixanthobacter sp.]|uniref:phage protease n=1 Tax=Pontixanthobacter sp. TaxID=2792078 RepID=UPI003C7B2412